MTTLSRRTRLLAPALTIALAAGFVGMVATPATAASSTFASTTDIFVDDNVVTATNATAISIPDSGVASVYPSAITVQHRFRAAGRQSRPAPVRGR